MDIVYSTGIDNKQLQAGLARNEQMIEAHIRAMQSRFGALNMGNALNFGGGRSLQNMAALNTHMEKSISLGGRLGQTFDKMGGQFTAGLGIGAAIGGLALLERAFTKSIEKARQFQTAHLAIAATLQSSYNLTTSSGRELQGAEAFSISKAKGQEFNQEIIKRQARNILVYEEQLGAFQSSIAAGARKGLNPNQVLDLSEQAAIVAKTLGLRGEQIANASRLLMGGGVNVGRSTIGRALGISNTDISSRSGDEFKTFLESKMKGFKAAEPDFAKSIEGILSTLEAKFDIFFAKVGGKFMAKITPAIEEFTGAFEGTNADKFAETLADLFVQLFNVLKSIIDSGALGVIAKGLEFLAKWGKDFVLAAVFAKLIGVLGTVGMGLASTVTWLNKVSAAAITSALSLEKTAAAGEAAAMTAGTATGVPMGGLGAPVAAAGASAVKRMSDAQLRAAAIQNIGMGEAIPLLPMSPGLGGVSNLTNKAGVGYASRRAAGEAQAIARREALIAQEMERMRASETAMLAQQGGPGAVYGATSGPLVSARDEMLANLRNKDLSLGSRAKLGAGYLGTMLPKIAMGGALGYMAGQAIQGATAGGPGEQAGSFAAGAAPVAGMLAPLAMGGGPVGWVVVAAAAALAGTLKMTADSLSKAKSELDAANANLESMFEDRPSLRGIMTPKWESGELAKQQRTGKIGENKGRGIMGWLETAFTGNETGEKAETSILGPAYYKSKQAQLEKAVADAKDAASAVFSSKQQGVMAEDYKTRAWALRPPAFMEELAGTTDPALMGLGYGTAYKRDIGSQHDAGLLAQLSELAANMPKDKEGGINKEDYARAKALLTDKFEADFNMPLKKLEASMSMLGFGDKVENAAALAKLAYEVTENKINDMVSIYGDLIDAASMTRQAKARRDVDVMLAQDTTAHRSILGSTAEQRIGTEGALELMSRENARRGLMNDATGNKYSSQLGGIFTDYGKQAAGGMFDNAAQGQRYLQGKLSTFMPQMELDYLGQGKQLNSLTRQRQDLVAGHAGTMQDIANQGITAGFNAEKATMAKEDWAANTAPQFADAAAAINWKVRAEMGQKEGFDPKQYEANAKRKLEIEKAEVDMAAQTADLALQRIDVGQLTLRAENDYQTALKELTIQIAEQSKVYATLGADKANVLKGLTGGASGGAGVTNNVTVTVGAGKLGMDDSQIRTLATQVKTELEQQCKRSNARKV